MHVCVAGAVPESLINFRGELIRTLVAKGHRVTAIAGAASEETIQDVASTGAEFHSFAIQRNGLNPIGEIGTLASLYRILRRLRPDMLVAYTIKPVIWGGIAARLVPGTRFIALVTGLGYAFQARGLAGKWLTSTVAAMYRASLRGAEAVIFQNADDRREFIRRGIVAPERAHLVAGSGVDLTHFSYVPPPPTGIVFLCIARLLGAKGLREYVAAARQVRRAHSDAVFQLLGPPDASSDGIPMHEVRQWHDSGTIRYLGSVKDVRPYIAASHVFVLPSCYREGLPRSILEAMAVGRPILTTDNVGCRDTVVPNRNGFLVPMRDSDALAERMIWFIENRDRLRQLGEASRSMAAEHFDVHRINMEILRIVGIHGVREAPL